MFLEYRPSLLEKTATLWRKAVTRFAAPARAGSLIGVLEILFCNFKHGPRAPGTGVARARARSRAAARFSRFKWRV